MKQVRDGIEHAACLHLRRLAHLSPERWQLLTKRFIGCLVTIRYYWDESGPPMNTQAARWVSKLLEAYGAERTRRLGGTEPLARLAGELRSARRPFCPYRRIGQT